MYENGAMAGVYEERKKSFIKSASLVLRYGLYGGQDGPATTMYFFLFISVESGKVSPQKFHIPRPPKSRSFCRTVSPLIVINLFDFIIPKSKISTIKSTLIDIEINDEKKNT